VQAAQCLLSLKARLRYMYRQTELDSLLMTLLCSCGTKQEKSGDSSNMHQCRCKHFIGWSDLQYLGIHSFRGCLPAIWTLRKFTAAHLEKRTLWSPARLILRNKWPARSTFWLGVRSFSWPLRYQGSAVPTPSAYAVQACLSSVSRC
jgi:hypothetical protein